ncbi:MAG: glycosyltransferase family 2 protein [Polyangiaceae bacterium]
MRLNFGLWLDSLPVVTASLAILVPCFGDNERLTAVLHDLRRVLADYAVTVYLVDDGSPRPVEWSRAWEGPGFRVRLFRHVVNLGQGAALETARRAAVRDRARLFLTVDADGQHAADDALRLVQAVERGADVALGNRSAGASNTPVFRRAVLLLARVFELALTGRLFGDAHNGLRAFSLSVAEALRIEHPRMAHGTGIMLALCAMRPKLRIVELPVTISYSAATLAKGQRASGAFTIVGDLLTHALFRPTAK